MAHSKKQKEHMVQNVVHKVRKQIKDMERYENCPEKKLEQELMHKYWEKKYREED